MKPRSFSKLILLLTILPFGAQAQNLWSNVLTPSRATSAWTEAGVSGGIPDATWTQCGTTIAAYGSTGSPGNPATIQNAINSCSANHFVQLAAGNFYLSGGFHIQGQSHIVVRGMGANSTFIYFYGQDNCQGLGAGICIESNDTNYVGSISNGPVSWSAGYAQSTTVITLASVPNLKIGNPIILDQLNTTTDVGAVLENDLTTGGQPFTSPGNAGPYATQGNSGDGARSGRDQIHIYKVVGCNGSTTPGASCSGTNVAVTIDPPIEETNWASGLTPQAWWATGPAIYDGVENLSFDNTNNGCSLGNGSGVGFFNTVDSWEVGVRDVNECRVHTWLQYSTHATIRSNYFFLGRDSTSTSYGFECIISSDSLLENNIIQAIAGGIVYNDGCDGIVAGYNFEINGFYGDTGFVIPMANLHNSNNDYDLFEGNIGSLIDGDIIHGTHNLNTIFRNRMSSENPVCWQSSSGAADTYQYYLNSTWGACTSAIRAMDIESNNRFYNVIGNVLGTTGVTTHYKSIGGASEQDGYVFNIGDGDNSTGVTVPPDSTVPQTITLWGNCDPTNGGAGGTAFTACQFNSSEVPVSANLATSQLAYANLVPANHTLPKSLYYSGTPTWWPSSKPFPIIGPDVTGGNIAGTNGLAYTNPAEDCYNSLTGSTSNGTGGPFPFDASVCYGSSSATQPPAPVTLGANAY
jgi:hypothetical protein